MSDRDMLDFFAEAGVLKRVRRSGWWMVGIPKQEEESVAEHSFRCAVIGYTLAKMEKADAYKVLLMTLFNDIHEARTGDSHKVASTYLNVKEADKAAFEGQVKDLGDDVGGELRALRDELDAQKTPESLIARDADILECLIQAKEYQDAGFSKAEKFLVKAPDHLKTESARRLWEEAKTWDSSEWWERLGKFER